MSSTIDDLLDTNVFIHAHASDRFTEECRHFLALLEQGQIRAYLEPLILHELSYALPHYLRQMTRTQVADYLLMILSWRGVQGQRSLMIDAVARWRATPGLSFADAYLAALASRRQCPVFTKNVREIEGQGVVVPQPLPSEPVSLRRRARRRRNGR